MPDEYEQLARSVLGAPTSRRSSRSNYDDIIERHATRTNLDPNLVRAVIGQESSGNPRARSHKNAQGLMQLIPATAKRFGVKNVYDPEENIRGGTEYLKFLTDRYRGNIDKVLAGYNSGEGNVDKYRGIPPFKETQNYVPSVKKRYQQLAGRSFQSQKSDDDPYRQLAEEVLSPQPDDEYTKLARSVIEPTAPSPSPTPQPKRSRFEGVRAGAQGEAVREYPAMQARHPGIIERATEAIKPYVPGLTSLDTPAGIKLDAPRGFVRGVTLGATGESRPITREDLLVDPDAEAKRNFAEGAGETVGAVVPYIGAGKALSKIPALAKATRSAHIARNAATFGGVEAAREGIHAIKTGEPMRPEEIAISTGIGAAMGGIAGVSPSMKRQVVAFLAPQIAVDIARGTPMEQAVQAGLTNLGFALTSGARGKTVIKAPRIRELRARLEAERVKEDATTAAIPEVGQTQPRGEGATSAGDVGQRTVGDRGTDVGLQRDIPNEVGVGASVERGVPISEPRRFYHTQYGNVVKAADQTGARKGKTKIYVEGNPEEIHYPKTVDLRGRGNERMVPLKEPASQPVEVLPENPQQPPETEAAQPARAKTTAPSPPETLRVEPTAGSIIPSVREGKLPSELHGIDARTKNWISDVLTNDATSTNAELVDYFQKEGGFNKNTADYIVSKRGMVKSLPVGLRTEESKPDISPVTHTFADGTTQILDPSTGTWHDTLRQLRATTSVEQGVKTIKGDAAQTPRDVPIESRKVDRPLAQGQQAEPTALRRAADEAQAKLDALGPEPPHPSNEKKAFGSQGKEAARTKYPEQVARWEAQTKAYNSWRRKYGELKKAQVEASNAAFREQQAAPPPKVSEQPIKEVINEATAQVTRPESTIVGEGAGLGGLERGTAPAPSRFGPGAASALEPFPEVKERKFAKRFIEDERIAQDIRESIGTARVYEPIPNATTAADAKRLVDERGVGQSINAIKDENNNIPFHVRVAMGEIVALKANKAYRNLKETNPKEAELVLDQANEAAEFLMDYGTKLGQGVQSFKMWAQQTPEGILLTYQKAVSKARQKQGKYFTEDVKEIVREVNSKMTDAERLDALKKLFATNKTARKVRSEFEKILKAAKDGKLTDSLFYEIAGEKLGLPTYNKEVAARITTLAEQIEAAPEGLPRDRKVQELHKYLAAQKGFTPGDLPLGVYYGNILSGYNTHLVNTIDTALNVISETNGLVINNPRAAAKIYSGLLRGFADGRLDALLELTEGRMATDRKWLDAPRLMEVAKFGQKGGVPIRATGPATRAMKRVAEARVPIVGGNPLNAYKYVTRLLAASDAVMFRSAKEARASLLAYRMVEAEGLKGDALDGRVRQILALDREADFMAQATREGFTGREAKVRAAELRDMVRNKELTSDAADFAGEATYNHEPHGTLGYLSGKVSEASEHVKPLKLFVPFTRIVANVTNRGLNYTPYGFKRALAGHGYGLLNEPMASPEARRLMLTRATLGTAALVALGGMQQAGLMQIHGAGPSDRERKRQLQNAGWRPYTIQIGDVFISYAYSPTGLGLSIIGNMTDSQRYHELEQKDAATRGAYAVARLGSTVFSQSFLSGLSRLFNALSESPSESVSAVKQTMSSTVAAFGVPNAVRDVYRLFDSNAYQANTLMEDLVRNTPFAALALKPQLNAFGEPVRVQRQRFFDVTTSDPAWRFVIQKGLKVPVPGRTLEIGKDERITPEQYYQLLSTTGPRLKQWVLANRSRLGRMKEDDAQDELQAAATRIRKFELTRMRLLARRKAA